ncbi:MAG: glycosyltransferase [Clostridia bacterium]|nr:glycosyltransferase [Clostridia bacterium]
MKYPVLIPAYKPDDKLVALVDDLLAHELSVLVVNDGSAPEYEWVFDAVRERGVEVLVHEVNQGKGAALKTGIAHLAKDPLVEGVVTADADGQHKCSDILRVMDRLSVEHRSIVLGVRKFAGKNVPMRSKIGNWTTKCVFFLVSGQRISDTQTGLRGLPKCFFNELLALEGNRYEYEMNMLLNVRHWHAHLVQIPIETVYIDENKGSSYNTWRDTKLILVQILKYCASSVVSTIADYFLYILLCSSLPALPFLEGLHLQTAAVWVVVSRIFSSALNFAINRFAVFRRGSGSSVAKFALLVVANILVAAFGVNCLVLIGVRDVAAKVIIDVPLFLLNYYVQNTFIFRPKTRALT